MELSRAVQQHVYFLRERFVNSSDPCPALLMSEIAEFIHTDILMCLQELSDVHYSRMASDHRSEHCGGTETFQNLSRMKKLVCFTAVFYFSGLLRDD